MIATIICIVVTALLMLVALMKDRPGRQRPAADRFVPSVPRTPAVLPIGNTAGRDVHSAGRQPDREPVRPVVPQQAPVPMSRFRPTGHSAGRKLL